jgi:hypothetical protein
LTSDSPIAIGLPETYWTKRAILLFFFVFFTKFRPSDEFFSNYCENSLVVGFNIVSGISAVFAVACIIVVLRLLLSVCISAAAGIPLVPDVLTVAGLPAFDGVPGVDVVSAVAFLPAVAGVSAFAVVPAVDGVFAVASFSANPGIPILL